MYNCMLQDGQAGAAHSSYHGIESGKHYILTMFFRALALLESRPGSASAAVGTSMAGLLGEEG